METQSDGWIHGTSSGGLDTEVFISSSNRYIAVNYLHADGRYTDAECLLSMWEAETHTEAKRVKSIKYINIGSGATSTVLNSFWRSDRINIDTTDQISSKTIKKPKKGKQDWRWTSLQSTRPGIVGSSFCKDFDEIQDYYVSSFDYGRDAGDGNRAWLRVNFSN
ncbi:hypothetical protein BROUX41_006331 [Berkeleyomyces rouxiae]|uniref:uncharacterized protein n=1 Tax=Berkeleyomyces rouxiae TaxID=2035830 RepID=UPI003B79D612